jgi:transcriptional regulator with XRE-family HTH domain
MIKVGSTIQKLRESAGLSQRKLARNAKITPSFLSLVENNHRDPSLTVLRRIASALHVAEEVIIWDAVKPPRKMTPNDRALFEAAKLIVRRYYETSDAAGSG